MLVSEYCAAYAPPMHQHLIFDVGMNNGDDAAHYLAKGFRVVGVEADPLLCDEARRRFRNEVDRGQLVVESAGVGPERGRATFYVNEQKREWSAFDPAIAGRAGMACRAVEVEVVTFAELLAKHGVPYYLKIDIERADRHCLEALTPGDLPRYVSIEAHEFEYLLLLWRLGYRGFKTLDQARHNSALPNFSNENALARAAQLACWYADRAKNKWGDVAHPWGSSGPFGEDTPGEWQTLEEAAYNWLHVHRGYRNRGTLNPRSWFDFHARLPE
jgi:FkbM family methyltransferase